MAAAERAGRGRGGKRARRAGASWGALPGSSCTRRGAARPRPAPPRSAGFRVQAAAEHPGRRERPSHVCSHEGEVRPVPAREELRDRPPGQTRGQDRSEPELHSARWAAGPRERREARTEGGREAPGAWSGAPGSRELRDADVSPLPSRCPAGWRSPPSPPGPLGCRAWRGQSTPAHGIRVWPSGASRPMYRAGQLGGKGGRGLPCLPSPGGSSPGC